MEVSDLKREVEAYRNGLKTKSGICMFSENGPVGMTVIDAMVKTLEALEQRIASLEDGSK